jgi:hypothetical protein
MALNRFYYPIKYKSRAEVVALGVTCIFISYQQQDKEAAEKVAAYLDKAGIDIYFDVYDKELRIHHQNKNPKKVTEAICNGINNSSHMLVIVSPNTVKSNWVPFEIGYGYDKTEVGVLCLKGFPAGSLPEYIRTAKVVRDIYDLNILVSHLTRKPADELIKRKVLNEYASAFNPLTNVMDTLISDTY